AGAPPCSKIVVAGLCMELDSFYPTFAIMKEIDLAFCIAYTPQEFAEVFAHIVSGRLKVEALITSHVGLGGVEEAFARLGDPERDIKVVVLPQSGGG
ncbi:MAG TPA: alcohol dehydrogenase, partial [Burkholderiales bacterium]